MTIHIHLYDCNCVFCGSDFPLDFFQSQNDEGPNSQSATVPRNENVADDEENDNDSEDEDDDEDDGEESNEEEEEENLNAENPNKRKSIFGFLIGKHDICHL